MQLLSKETHVCLGGLALFAGLMFASPWCIGYVCAYAFLFHGKPHPIRHVCYFRESYLAVPGYGSHDSTAS